MRSLSRFVMLPSLVAATVLLSACSERGIQGPAGPSGSLGSLVVGVLTSNGEALAGATVALTGPEAVTVVSGTDGGVTFTNLPPGVYSVTGMADGFTCGTTSASVLEGRTTVLEVSCTSLLEASWSGAADPIELTLTLDQALLNGQISGSGVVGSVHAAFDFTVTGQITDSRVSMDLTISGEDPITFQGTLTSDDRIVGTFNGAGFDRFGLSLEPMTGGGGEESQFDPSAPQPGVSAAFAGQYEGDWTILIRWTDAAEQVQTVVGDCPGSVWLEQQTVLDRLFGRNFEGSYFIDDAGACLSGSTVSGEVSQGQLRDDGGVNFGLEIPGSDGNFFEDVLAGSGVSSDPDLLGCAIVNKDLENQMDGSILGTDLLAAASASLDCPRLEEAVTLRVSIDVAKTS